MLDQVEKAYETVFAGKPADSQFFSCLEAEYRMYQQRTKKRPIKVREIKAAEIALRDKCRQAMKEAKQRERSSV